MMMMMLKLMCGREDEKILVSDGWIDGNFSAVLQKSMMKQLMDVTVEERYECSYAMH